MPGYLFVHGRPYGLQELRLEGIQVFAGDDVIYPMPFRPPEEEGEYRPTEAEEFNELLKEAAERVQIMQEEEVAPEEIAKAVADWLREEDPTLEVDINRFDYDVGVATPEMSKEGWAVVIHAGIPPEERVEELSDEEWARLQTRLEKSARSFLRTNKHVLERGGVVLISYGYMRSVPLPNAVPLLEGLVKATDPQLSTEEQMRRVKAFYLPGQVVKELLENAPHDYLRKALEQTLKRIGE